MWISFSAFPQLFKNHIKKEEGREAQSYTGLPTKDYVQRKEQQHHAQVG